MANNTSKRRGPPPNLPRRQEAAEYRRQGLSFPAIARRMGITHQAVQQLIAKLPEPIDLPRIRCCACHGCIWPGGKGVMNNRPTYCLQCLAKHPEIPFGQRLRAFRLAAHLSQPQLADRVGLQEPVIRAYESGRRQPNWRSLGKLIRQFGVELVDVSLWQDRD